MMTVLFCCRYAELCLPSWDAACSPHHPPPGLGFVATATHSRKYHKLSKINHLYYETKC